MQHEPIGSAHDLLACAFIARKNGDDETAARFKAGAERINALEAVLRSYLDACDNEECEYCIAARAALEK